VSAPAQTGELHGQTGELHGQGSRANVTAHFAFIAGSGEQTADAAAELIHRLQEMANLPACAYELDIDVEWPAAMTGSPDRRPGAGSVPSPGSRPGSH
jgi:hypothetical protein